MNEHHKLVTEESLKTLIAWIDKMRKEYFEVHYPNLTMEPVVVLWGRKNIKVIDGGRGGVWAFIEIETGKIMKAASYKTPEPKRHERGNVNDPTSWPKWLDIYGPKYLR